MGYGHEGPDRSPMWVAGAVVVVLTAAATWWILRSGDGPRAGAPAVPSASPLPCDSTSSSAGGSGVGGSVTTQDWTVTLSSVRAEPTVRAQDEGTYRAAPGEVFVVLDVTFANRHPGREAVVSSTEARLVCEDGTVREPAGLDGGEGFCRVCSFDLGTDEAEVRWSFLYRMGRTAVGQAFQFRYGDADPIPFTIAPSA